MAYAVAKLVVLLTLTLLVAHVDSARLLKQWDATTATTFPTPDVADAEVFTEHTNVPYNYNFYAPVDTTTPELASVDGDLFAAESVVVGRTTPAPPLDEESYIFDAQHGDAPIFDATSLALGTRQFEFQEAPDEVGGPGFFAFEDSTSFGD